MFRRMLHRLRGGPGPLPPGYTALAIIRDGPLSVVFRAKDDDTGRAVAVKVRRPDTRKSAEKPDPAFGDLTEGLITAAFDHPNVVQCLDHGRLGEAPYLVLEYLEAVSLAGLMGGDTGRLAGQRGALVRQAAAALAHVHSRRFIHHDFCPKNLLVTHDNVLKLIDFGLAAPLLETPKVAPVAATHDTLAPEVIRREPSDHRADVFSWGVVAYQVLSGHWPFESTEHHHTLGRILNVQPLNLARRVPELPAEMAELVMRCLDRDAGHRPNSMTAVLGAMERHTDVTL